MSNAADFRSARPAHVGAPPAAEQRAAASTKSGRFLLYIHQFRAVAIIFVIASHTPTTFDWSRSPFSLELVATLFGNGTFLFVFIAGFIFRYLFPKYETRTYYMNKLRNVLLPYLIIGFPAVVVMLLRDDIPGTFPGGFQEWPVILKVLWLYATGTMLLPLWFIPMISLMFLLAPLLVRADRSGWIYRWLPLMYVISLFIARPFGNDNPLQAFLIYFPVYVLGMWSARNIDWIISLIGRFWILLVAAWLAVVAVGMAWFSAHGAMYTDSIFAVHEDIINISNIEKALLCYLLIYFLYLQQDRIGSRLNVLANYSFGLFFLHEYFILTARLALQALDVTVAGNVLFYLLYTCLIILVTLGAVGLLKYALGTKSRFVVGS